jgi:hypothetical protein
MTTTEPEDPSQTLPAAVPDPDGLPLAMTHAAMNAAYDNSEAPAQHRHGLAGPPPRGLVGRLRTRLAPRHRRRRYGGPGRSGRPPRTRRGNRRPQYPGRKEKQ